VRSDGSVIAWGTEELGGHIPREVGGKQQKQMGKRLGSLKGAFLMPYFQIPWTF